jgi:hypothetical protein
MIFGETIRKQRECKKIVLRQNAPFLQVDTAFPSNIESLERNASRVQVIKLVEFLDSPAEPLITIWLANKISDTINDSMDGEEALKLVLKTYKKK